MIRNVLKAALPGRIVRIMRDLRRVDPGARARYLRLLWQRRGRRVPTGSPTRHSNVVVICHGNILRSVFAEALLRQAVLAGRAPGLRVSSAGLHAVPGKAADPRGVVVAREWGVDLTAHHAIRLTAEAVAAADQILVMDLMNLAELVSYYPASADKAALLGEFDPSRRLDDPVIPDPYTGDLADVRASYSRVAAAVEGLMAAPPAC